MRRLATWGCAALLLAVAGSTAGRAAEASQAGEAHGADHTTLWKVANFILLAGGLGYLIHKKGSAFFHARTGQIQGAIEEASRLRAEAEARAAAIEARLANLEAEIEDLRRSARARWAVERESASARIRQDVAKIQAEAEREIASKVQAARQALRRQAAELAVALAEQQIRSRMTPPVEEQLVAAAVRQLGQAGSGTARARRPA